VAKKSNKECGEIFYDEAHSQIVCNRKKGHRGPHTESEIMPYKNQRKNQEFKYYNWMKNGGLS
jgi:hypothetical protein